MSAPRLLCSMAFSLAIAFAIAGCSSDTQDPNTGALSLELTIAGDIEIDEVAWVITGGDMPAMNGTIDTSAPGSTASIEVFGLPASIGKVYTITMEAIATDGETTCKGSEDFGIDIGEVTEIMVMLNCKRPQRLGSVRVNGKFNVCAELTKVVVSPLQTSLGNDIDLFSAAEDVEGDDIDYLWIGTGGSIDNAQAASTTYTCTDLGDHFVKITVTDEPDSDVCDSSWTVEVRCVLGDGGTGGTGGDGGTAGSGGVGGDAGTGGAGGAGGAGAIPGNFQTSLHYTRAGQEFWYRDTNGGFESLINVAYDGLTCQGCHDNTAFPDWTEPTCADCHAHPGVGDSGGGVTDPNTCLGCHGRQKGERGKLAMDGNRADVHTNSTSDLLDKGCASCHGLINGATDVHGNGIEYDSLLRPGAIAARCEDCHSGENAPMTSGYHSQNHADVDCALCHTETVISCINCHFDTEVDLKQKCAATQVFNWKFVMKWDKEGDGDPKFHPATMMTMKYNCARPGDHPECTGETVDPKKTFAVLAPYYAHTVTSKAVADIATGGGCAYCHSAFGPGAAEDICAVIDGAGGLNDKQKLIEWNATTNSLSNPIGGLIPLPPDYQDRFEIDYAEFSAGAGTACLTDGSPSPLVFFETGPDLWQTGADFDISAAPREELGRPLTEDEYQVFCP